MDRRQFLRILAGAAPVAAIAPTYFFAPRGGWKTSASGMVFLYDRAKMMDDADAAGYYRILWEKYPRVFGEQRIGGKLKYFDPAEGIIFPMLSKQTLMYPTLKGSDDA